MRIAPGKSGGLLRPLAALALVGVAVGPIAAGEAPAPGSYDLTVAGESVSLHAVEGSLIGILRDLGGRVGFEVLADATQDAKISTRFENLPVDQAIRRIVGKTGYVEVTHPETGKTSRLILTAANVRLSRTASKPYEPPLPRPPVVVEPAEEEPTSQAEAADEQASAEAPVQNSNPGSASGATPQTQRIRRKNDRRDDDD